MLVPSLVKGGEYFKFLIRTGENWSTYLKSIYGPEFDSNPLGYIYELGNIEYSELLELVRDLL